MPDNLDTSTKLAMLLAALGNSIGRSSNDAGGILGGVTQGANDFFAGYGAYNKLQSDAADKAAQIAYHQAQGRRLDAQTAMEAEKLRFDRAADEAYIRANGGLPGAPPTGLSAPGATGTPQTGLSVPPTTPTIGPGTYGQRLAAVESPYGATNPQSGAVGHYQFMPTTAHSLAQQTAWGRGMTQDQVIAAIQADPAKNNELLGLYTGNSDRTLTGAGMPVNDANRYALHWFGAGGGPSLLRADPNMPVTDWLRTVQWDRGATPETVFAQNNLGRFKTVGELREFIARTFPGDASPVGGGGGVTQTQYQPPGGRPAGPPPVSLDNTLALNPDGSPAVRPDPAAGMSVRVPDAVPAPAPPDGTTPPGTPPGGATPPGAPPAAPPAVPRPTQLPPQMQQQLNQMIAVKGWTRGEAETKKQQLLGELWTEQRDRAKTEWEAQREEYRHRRGVADEERRYGREAGTTRLLTADEAKERGFPPGGVYQEDRTGGLKVIQPPPGYKLTTLADGQLAFYDEMDPRKPPIPFGPAKPAGAATESQAKSAARITRMVAASPTVDAFEQLGTSGSQRFFDKVPGGFGNYAQSADYQKFKAAAATWIVSHLRDDSGGAITNDEWTLYGPMYFPQPGDDPSVVAFKRTLRQAVEKSLLQQTAPGFKPPEPKPPAPSSAQPTMPKVGDVLDGHRFKGGDPKDQGSWEKVR